MLSWLHGLLVRAGGAPNSLDIGKRRIRPRAHRRHDLTTVPEYRLSLVPLMQLARTHDSVPKIETRYGAVPDANAKEVPRLLPVSVHPESQREIVPNAIHPRDSLFDTSRRRDPRPDITVEAELRDLKEEAFQPGEVWKPCRVVPKRLIPYRVDREAAVDIIKVRRLDPQFKKRFHKVLPESDHPVVPRERTRTVVREPFGHHVANYMRTPH